MKKTLSLLTLLLGLVPSTITAQRPLPQEPTDAGNPIVQTCFSTDPAPLVSGDKLYVFTGHDEDNADFFWMNEWRLFCTSDMVNWQDLGCPLSQCDFSWADDRSWAAQCVERNGKFYFYVCAHSNISHGMAIGVAVSDRVEGPYHDALGKPLYEDGKWDHIDPTVWIDDDGQAYVGWGNPKYYSAKLSDDMIHLASEVQCDTAVGRAGVADVSAIKRYTEGPWLIHQRALSKAEVKAMGLTKKELKASAWGKYFLVYAAGGVPECIAYSESDSPQGPWTYVGEIMPQTNFTASFTNHSGVVQFKGHDYFFYHTGWLPRGGGFARSVSVEEFQWQRDGRFPVITPTREGVQPVGTFSLAEKVEAETMAYSQGLRTEWNTKQRRIWVSDIHNGDWLKVREVDFGTLPASVGEGRSLTVTAASALQGGQIEVRLDSLRGEKICTLDIRPTGGWEEWQSFTAPVTLPTEGNADAATHDLYFLFKGLKGCKLFNLDEWRIK